MNHNRQTSDVGRLLREEIKRTKVVSGLTGYSIDLRVVKLQTSMCACWFQRGHFVTQQHKQFAVNSAVPLGKILI